MIYGRCMLPNISPQLSTRLDAASRTMHILWFALMASVATYGSAVFVIASQGEDAPARLPLPSFVFPMVAVMLAITGSVLYRQQTSPDRIRTLLQEKRAADSQEQQLGLSERELRLNRVPGLVFTGAIIRWALFESIAVLGLVLGISHLSFEDFVPYGIAALALQAMTPPKVRQVTLSAVPLLPSDA